MYDRPDPNEKKIQNFFAESDSGGPNTWITIKKNFFEIFDGPDPITIFFKFFFAELDSGGRKTSIPIKKKFLKKMLKFFF